MIIEEKKINKNLPFQRIVRGTIFKSDDRYYMKLNGDFECNREIYDHSYFNAVNVSDGTLEWFDDEMLVLPMISRLLIEL